MMKYTVHDELLDAKASYMKIYETLTPFDNLTNKLSTFEFTETTRNVLNWKQNYNTTKRYIKEAQNKFRELLSSK